MSSFHYSCKKNELHPILQSVWDEQELSEEGRKFREKKSRFYHIKFILFVMMSVVGIRHYTIMGILGYKTYLLDKQNIEKMIGTTKRKKLLDIGAGNGCITEKFSSFVDNIYYSEPSLSFGKILRKKGYKKHQEKDNNRYDIITLFNVLDVCDKPEEIIEWAGNHLDPQGDVLISLPFPIRTQSWDNRKIRTTNTLTQDKEYSFEQAVSNFYENFIRKNNLRVTFFTRLPYIVLLPEAQKTTVYDNGLFVCKKG